MTKVIIIGLVILFVFTSLCLAKVRMAVIVPVTGPPPVTYFIAPSSAGGNDTNNGLSSGAPWLTPNHALNCGDVILAAAGTYNEANFRPGQWGIVSCPTNDNVAWLKCSTFDTCKINITVAGHDAMTPTRSYWGVQGWEVTASTVSTNQCFEFYPPDNTTTIHHDIFANNIANGCGDGAFTTGDVFVSTAPSAGVDYSAIIGNIAYNGAKDNAHCYSGIDIVAPFNSDTIAGTHFYIAGNFAWGNVDPNPCQGGVPTDGHGISIDTVNDVPAGNFLYSGQIFIDNNISIFNGGTGIQAFDNQGGSPNAPIIIRGNTTYGNQTGAINANPCAEVNANFSLSTQAYSNLIQTAGATACAANIALYALGASGGDSSVVLTPNMLFSAAGNNVSCDGANCTGNLVNNPGFANPVMPPAPNCGSFASVPACMASVIANFVPSTTVAKPYGYHTPGATAFDPLFPQWLCHVTNMPSGLVTMGCPTPSPTPTPTPTPTPSPTPSPTPTPGSTRTDYGQLLEPIGDHILSAVGQVYTNSDGFYQNFANAVGKSPAIYTAYISTGEAAATTTSRIAAFKSTTAGLANTPIMFQIGLDMCATFCTGSNDATAAIAAGNYDSNLNNICTQFQTLGVPIYVRIGYEFSNSWNGYSQASYPAAFQRIANILHACANTNIATAWVFYPGGNPYGPYYPGDAYVDWWGVDTFNVGDFSAVQQFMTDSRTHRKPVLIGESTPESIGASTQNSWNTWFVPFFNFIAANQNVKQVNYINIDWTGTNLSSWGNAIIPVGSFVATNYAAQLANPQWLFTNANIRSQIYLSSRPAPPALNNPQNPVNYGADPTGANDATSSFQSALNHTPAGDLDIPAGTFLINGSVKIPDNRNIRCEAGAIIHVSSPSNNVQNFQWNGTIGGSLFNCQFRGPNYEAAIPGTHRPGYSTSTQFQYFVQLNTVGGRGGGTTIVGNDFNGNWGNSAIEIYGSDSSGPDNNNTISYNTFEHCGFYGPIIDSGNNNVIRYNVMNDCSAFSENDDNGQQQLNNLYDSNHLTFTFGNGYTVWSYGEGGLLSNPNLCLNFSTDTYSNNAIDGTYGSTKWLKPNTVNCGTRANYTTGNTCTGSCSIQ